MLPCATAISIFFKSNQMYLLVHGSYNIKQTEPIVMQNLMSCAGPGLR
jgi:hypothetical protein